MKDEIDLTKIGLSKIEWEGIDITRIKIRGYTQQEQEEKMRKYHGDDFCEKALDFKTYAKLMEYDFNIGIANEKEVLLILKKNSKSYGINIVDYTINVKKITILKNGNKRQKEILEYDLDDGFQKVMELI